MRYATARKRRLPDYIIAGAQKAGTTSLWAYLNEHPDVDPPITKELYFFNRYFHHGLDWYRMHFPLAREGGSPAAGPRHTLTGEATPSYIFHPDVPKRARRILPAAKVILLLRNPVDRAFSHYQLKRKRRQETRTFDEAVGAEIERLETDREYVVANLGYAGLNARQTYLARGLYADQIVRWQRVFPPGQLLILESGRFFRHTGEVFQQVCDFLGLPRWQPPAFGNRYPGGYRDKMRPATRRKLVEYFAPHNARLFERLGTRFAWDR